PPLRAAGSLRWFSPRALGVSSVGHGKWTFIGHLLFTYLNHQILPDRRLTELRGSIHGCRPWRHGHQMRNSLPASVVADTVLRNHLLKLPRRFCPTGR